MRSGTQLDGTVCCRCFLVLRVAAVVAVAGGVALLVTVHLLLVVDGCCCGGVGVCCCCWLLVVLMYSRAVMLVRCFVARAVVHLPNSLLEHLQERTRFQKRCGPFTRAVTRITFPEAHVFL